MEDVRQAIEQAVQKFIEAFKRGDAAAVASLYAEDAKLLPPNQRTARGREAIRQFWQGVMDMGVKEADIEIQEVEAQDDTAYEVGRYTLTIQQGNGERASDAGKYVVIWKRQGDGWKLAVDIFNSDTPTAGR